MTTPYDDGGGEPLAAPPSAHTPPGFGPPGQRPAYQGTPLAAPKVPRQRLFVGLMAFFGLLALVAVAGFFVTAGEERGGSAVVRDGTVLRPFPTDDLGVSQAPLTPRPTGGGRTLGPVPKPVTYRGTGTKTIRIRRPAGVAIVDMTGRAASTGVFAVYTVGADGSRTGAVVNAFGPSYEGSRLLVDSPLARTAALEISASGPWTVTVRSERTAREMGRSASGSGDTVFLYTGKAGIARVRGGADRSLFVVNAMENGFRRSVVNELGTFNGTKPWPAGPVLVEVQAKGRWTVVVG